MAKYLTLARPYARAIFSQACKSDTLQVWLDVLQILAIAVEEPNIKDLLNNPTLKMELLEDLLLSVIRECADNFSEIIKESLCALLRLLIPTKRLVLLKDIFFLYSRLLYVKQNIVEATVEYAYTLNSEQKRNIKTALESRFNSNVVLKLCKNREIIGGLIIRVGHWVIDNSIRRKIEKLKGCIALQPE